jgi:hypothetical protein
MAARAGFISEVSTGQRHEIFIYCYDPLGHAVKPLVDVLLQ